MHAYFPLWCCLCIQQKTASRKLFFFFNTIAKFVKHAHELERKDSHECASEWRRLPRELSSRLEAHRRKAIDRGRDACDREYTRAGKETGRTREHKAPGLRKAALCSRSERRTRRDVSGGRARFGSPDAVTTRAG